MDDSPAIDDITGRFGAFRIVGLGLAVGTQGRVVGPPAVHDILKGVWIGSGW